MHHEVQDPLLLGVVYIIAETWSPAGFNLQVAPSASLRLTDEGYITIKQITSLT